MASLSCASAPSGRSSWPRLGSSAGTISPPVCGGIRRRPRRLSVYRPHGTPRVTSLLVLRLLVDTSVWLDTARDIHGERMIAAVRTLVQQGHVELLVPQVVVEEYDRNRGQVIASLSASTRAHVRTVRAALAEHGRSERNDELIAELDEVAVRGPLIEQLVVNRFTEVQELLAAGRTVAVPTRRCSELCSAAWPRRRRSTTPKTASPTPCSSRPTAPSPPLSWPIPRTPSGSSLTTSRTSPTRRTTASPTQICRTASPARTPVTSSASKTRWRCTCRTRPNFWTTSTSRSTRARGGRFSPPSNASSI